MRTLDPERDWETLLSYLPGDYEQMAAEHKQLNTQWKNAKISSAAVLLRFIFLHVGADLALRQTVNVMAQAGAPKLSHVRLHFRMRRAYPFLASLVARMTADVRGEAAPELWGGYEMMCLDGSTVCGPGAEGIDARLHLVLRLSDLRVVNATVTDVSEGETLRRFYWSAGQLVIIDRGYSNAPGIVWAVDQGADVLVRLNRGALPVFDDQGAQIDILSWCRALSGHRATEQNVEVTHREGRRTRRVPGRLIGFRLPEAEAAQARKRAREETGPSITAEQLEAAEYVVLFTTVPADRLSAARCIEAYRLRWQVELQFKRWKSLCHLDRLPDYRDDTILSWVTAKVLLGLLLDRIGDVHVAAPTWTSRPSRAMARQPWQLTAILWPMIVAAILPMHLHDTIAGLPEIVVNLEAADDDVDQRQVTLFRNRFYPALGQRASGNR
jgi:DDE family transposase